MSEFKATFEVKGVVLEVGETRSFGPSGFSKREVIVETSNSDKFSSPVCVTLKRDKTAQADSLHEGDSVEVTGFVEGRRWEGPNGVRHFIDLSANSILVTGRATLPTTAASWKELVALGKAYGEDEAAVVERCKAYGKPFKEMGEADWQKLAAAIVAARTAEGGDGAGDGIAEDVPF